MADRLPALVPRLAAIVLIGLAATAALTLAADRRLGSSPSPAAAAAPKLPLVVPDVRNQAFVFAKGSLEDSGFAWRVSGAVHGFAANTVAEQSPAPGTRVLDTGAPLITLSLKRNGGYAETGQAEDVSPYPATALEPADLAAAVGPAAPATTPAPVPKTAPAAKPTPKPAATAKPAAYPQNRPPAFVVPGGRKEPLDEMPLPDRAQALGRWLDAHQKQTPAAVAHWLYQNAWIVAGAKLGWWRGADALTTLIAVDRRAQSLWGIGAKSALAAQRALSEVRSRSK